jgi:uncharacterized membrane protein YqhA
MAKAGAEAGGHFFRPEAASREEVSRRGGSSLFEHLLKIRFLAAVVVLLSVLHAVTFLFLGARSAMHTYVQVFGGTSLTAPIDRPGLELLHSLDFMLVSLVLIILATGVAKLFLISPAVSERIGASLPSWLNIETFSDLKTLLWESVLFALLIIGLSALTSGVDESLRWTALIIPGAILLLSLSLYFLKKTHPHG